MIDFISLLFGAYIIYKLEDMDKKMSRQERRLLFLEDSLGLPHEDSG